MTGKSKGAATERGTGRALSPVALSRLTWTAADRQAWDDAYRAAICIAARRTAADTYRLSLLARRKNARAALVAYEGCSEDGTCDSFTLYGSCDHSVRAGYSVKV